MDTNLLLIGVLAVLAIGLVAYSVLPRKAEPRDAVKRRLAGRRGADDEAMLRDKARAFASGELVRKATPVLSKLILPTSDEEQSNLRLKLANAGFRRPQAQTLFLASKSICAVIALVLAVVAGLTAHVQWSTLIGLAAGAAGLGIMLPDLWLSGARRSRKQKIRHGLPDTLDLMVVSVEAGLGLDAALKRVGDEMAHVHPDLSEELRLATMETQMGLRRIEALENMARRTGLDEVRSLVSVIVQAEKFGTSVAKALRNQADALRVKRRQAAEEKAQKTAVKLMIPLVLFIFPAIAVVLGGPAIISAVRAYADNPALAGN
ncbi:MAG: type II secretion system F family protein [Planctomycetota bacterium]